MKEPNGYKGEYGPLNERLRRAATISSSKLWNRPTFHNLGRWAYGLANYAGQVPAFEEADRAYRPAVLGCAYINIKKSSGGARATKAVDAHAATYGHFVRRQVETIAPDIVVCGGTWRMLKDHVFPDMTRVSHRVHAVGSRLFINAFHPGCRTSRREVYDQVLSSYHAYLSGTASKEMR